MSDTPLDLGLFPGAKRLLEQLGQDGTIEYVSGGTQIDDAGRVVGPDPTSVSVKASPPIPVPHQIVDGQRIQAGDSDCYVAAKDAPVVPSEGMYYVAADSRRYTITGVESLASGNRIAAYRLILRSGV